MSTHEAQRHVEGEVRELIRRSGIDPAHDLVGVRRLVQDAVADYDDRSLHGGLPPLGDQRSAVHAILAVVAGYGALQQYFDDPTVEEIWINSPSQIFVARGGVAELTTTILTADEVRDLVERMLKASGRRVDLSSPFVDATLSDGSRLHVVIPDIARAHWQVNVRKFVVKADHLDDLVKLGTVTKQAATFLGAAVASGLNLLVAGGTQAGKTTLLNCLAAAIPPRERVITCEEVFELKISLRDVASNSGVPGMCSVHANSAREAVTKMCTLPLLAGENVSSRFVVPTVAAAIDIVVHVALERDGVRRVREIVAVPGRAEGDIIEVADLFVTRGGRLRRADGFPPHRESFERAGYELSALLAQGDS